MAFVQRSFSSGGGAGRADVEFRTNLGKFRADVTEARQVYQRTTGAMSDSALRMAVSQEKLDRAIHKFGAESRQAKSATLAYRQEMRALETQTDRTGREFDQTRRRMDRTFRGALAGSGIFKSLRGSIAFASSAFLGGAGLIYALRSTVNAAKEAESAESQLTAALKAQGIELADHRKQIEATIRERSRLSAFDDEELTRGFTSLVRRTGDVTEALELMALATEVARGRTRDFEHGLQIVLKASLGQAGALRRASIEVEKNASATELLALLQEKYAGSAKAYGDDAAGAQDRWNVALENAQEIVGTGLLPTLTELFNRGADNLDQLADSGELQRKVNQIVDDGASVVRGLASALRLVKGAADPVVGALGGIENAVQTALILGVVYKSAKAIAAVRALALSFGLVGPAATRSALAANLATASIGTGALTAAGRVGTLRASLLGLARIGPIAIPIALIIDSATGGHGMDAIKRAITDEATERVGDLNPRRLKGTWVAEDGTRIADQRYWERLYRQGYIDASGKRRVVDAGPDAHHAENADTYRHNRAAERRGSRVNGGRRPPRTSRTESDIQLDIARAGATPGTGDDLSRLRELRELYQGQIADLEARKSLTEKQKERLRQLYGSIAGTQSAIDSIIDEGERQVEERRENAAEAREQARKRAAAARQKARERARQLELARERKEERDFLDFERRTRDRDLRRARGRDARAGFGGGLASAMLRDANRKATAQKARDEGRGSGDPAEEAKRIARRIIDNVFSEWERQQRDLANNFQRDGSSGGDAQTAMAVRRVNEVDWMQQLHLMREQNTYLRTLVAGSGFAEQFAAKSWTRASFEGE